MRPTEPFRREHEQLLEHIDHLTAAAREMPRLDEAERELVRQRVVGFLRGTLIPHAQAEEEVLYPAWSELVGYPDAAAPMIHDHEAIVARVVALEQADVRDVDHLQELLYGLSALVGTHFRKEEDLQLPVFDAAPPDVTRDVLARMEAAAPEGHRHAHG